MSKMSAEGSIPSGRAASLTEENQALSPPATGHTSGVRSVLGPEHEQAGARFPRVGEVIESCAFGETADDWKQYTVIATTPRLGKPVVDPGDGSMRPLSDLEWRWPGEVRPIEKAKRVPVPFRDRVEVREGPVGQWRSRLVLAHDPAAGLIQVPGLDGSLLRCRWCGPQDWRWPTVEVQVCPGCGEVVTSLDRDWGLCDRCARQRRERSERAAADPRVTHGKNGVPPLPAVPDPNAEPRRCAGAPGCSCDAVLGPVSECPSDKCAHCENFLREIERQTADSEEGFVDCDGCQPERLPRTGRLCGRCLARQKAFVADVSELLGKAAKAAAEKIRALVFLHYMTADEAQGIRSGLDVVLAVLAAELRPMSARQEVTMVALLREAVGSLIGIRAADGEGVAKAVRS